MRKFFLLTVILAFALSGLKAQETPAYDLYTIQPFILNPACAGDADALSVFLNSKQMWTGLDNAPSTYTLGVHSPFNQNVNLGGMISRSQSGVFEYFSGTFTYGYDVKMSKNQQISFGLAGGFTRYGLNYDAVQTIDMNDPKLYNDYFNKTRFSGGFGIRYQVKGLNIHLSAPQLFDDQNNIARYYIGMASYDISVGESLIVRPSFMYRSLINSPQQFDGNLMLSFKNKVFVQAGYRSNKDIILSAGVNVSNLNFAYAYELSNSNIASISNGSHEFIIGFRFGKQDIEYDDFESVSRNSKTGNSSKSDDELLDEMKELLAYKERYEAAQAELKAMESENQELQSVVNYQDSIIYQPQGRLLVMNEDGSYTKLQRGVYVVMATFSQKSSASTIKGILDKHEIKNKIVQNADKGYYNLYSKRFGSVNEAMTHMNELKDLGLTSCWVHVFE